MRLYFSRTEQIAAGVLLLAILGALLVLSYAYGKKEHPATALPPLLEQHADSPAPAVPPAAPVTSVTPAPSVPPPTPAGMLVVHVAGAVQKPGVYTLPSGARIYQAVEQAGGARPEGVPDALNLAEPLEDGEKIVVPTKAEVAAIKEPPTLVTRAAGTENTENAHFSTAASSTKKSKEGKTGAGMAGAGKTSAGKSGAGAAGAGENRRKKEVSDKIVHLNTATLEELETLTGIGAVTAQRILDYRKEHGKFNDVSELLNIERIGPKTMAKNAARLAL